MIADDRYVGGRWNVEIRKLRQRLARLAGARLQVHGHERGAIAKRARVVLIAGRLVDLHLLPVLGHHRGKAHAVRLLHAIAAAFADLFIDHQAFSGLRHLAARACPALLSGAFLVVDDGRDAGELFHFRERAREFLTVAQFDIFRQEQALIALDFFSEDHDLAHAFRLQLRAQLWNRKPSGRRSGSNQIRRLSYRLLCDQHPLATPFLSAAYIRALQQWI